MLATQAILFVTLLGNAILFTAVLKERASLMRGAFALYLALIFGWTFTIFCNLFLSNLLIEEWVFATAALMLTVQFWFVKLFPSGKLPASPLEYWSLLLGFFFALASFYPRSLFTAITVHPEGYTTLDSGPLSIAYSLFALFYACAPTVVLFRKYFRERSAEQRNLLRHLAIGFTLFMILAVLTNSILPVFFQIYTFNAIGPSLSLIFASFAFYVSWSHEFLDIRKIMLRGVIYSFVIGCVVILYLAFLASTEQYLESIRLLTWIHVDDVIDPLTVMVVTALGIASAPTIERYFQIITGRIFFKDRYNYPLALESLSNVLVKNVDFDSLMDGIRVNLARTLRAESVDLVLYDSAARQGPLKPDARSFASREELFEPIRNDREQIGHIVIGPKSSGDKYRAEDARLLRTFALQASTAFARTQLFMQVRRHASELEQKVAERTDELRRMRESERQTMLDIAHGLQTPLAVLRSKLDRLKPATEDQVDLETLDHSLNDLTDFVTDLLRLAHFEHTKSLDPVSLDLSEILADLCDEADIITEPLGIRIVRHIASGIEIRADERELRLALMNLIANSIKYMRPTGTRVIEIDLSASDRAATLAIRDTGIGIPAEDLVNIFDRFYRSGGSSGHRGSGLGLAITKAIIERHGGTIEAESDVNKGTSMIIRFPYQNKA